ncbi:MAG: hypothetical protein KC646_01425 [Candidatus Cloacimonetes bacterium]|nr:hypothetical protein [Candidatus Cloacimonadota bacterium]
MKTLVITLVLCFSLVVSTFSQSFNLVNTLMVSGNYSQALFYLSSNRQRSQAPDADFYKELLNYLIHRDLDHLKNVLSTYDSLSDNKKTLLEDTLINFYKKNSLNREELTSIKFTIPADRLKMSKWRELFLKSKLENGFYEEIIKENTEYSSALVMQYVYDAHSALNTSKDFFDQAKSKTFSLSSMKIKFIQLLLLEGHLDQAKDRFQKIRGLKTNAIAELMIEIADRTNDKALLEEAYLLKIKKGKRVFHNTRNLASFYFTNNKAEQGKKLLFDYLAATGNSFQYPKDVAQVLIDHNQFESLVSFVAEYRKKLNFKSYMTNVLLFSYSMRMDHKAFINEVVYAYGRVSGKYLAQKIADSYSEDKWVLVLDTFAEMYPKFGPVVVEMAAMLAEKQVDMSINLSPFLRGHSSEYIISLAHDFYKISKFKSVLFLLEKQDKSNQDVQYILGNSYYQLGKLSKAWIYLNPLVEVKSDNLELLKKVILLSKNNVISSTRLLKIIQTRNSIPVRLARKNSKALLQIEAFALIATLQWKKLDTLLEKEKSHFDKSDLQVLFFFKSFFTYDYENAKNIAKAFLYIELKHPYYAQMVDMYEFLLYHTENLEKEFFPHLVDIHRMIMSNEVEKLQKSIDEVKSITADDKVFFKISPFLAYSTNQKNKIKASIETDLAKKRELFAKWEKSSIEMFEEFPQAHYTSWVIEQLSDFYEENKMKDKQASLIKSYLLKFPSNLLAQRLRNKLL